LIKDKILQANLEINLGEVMMPLRSSLHRPWTATVWSSSFSSSRSLARIDTTDSRPPLFKRAWVSSSA
jgi:hypothetical protein